MGPFPWGPARQDQHYDYSVELIGPQENLKRQKLWNTPWPAEEQRRVRKGCVPRVPSLLLGEKLRREVLRASGATVLSSPENPKGRRGT